MKINIFFKLGVLKHVLGKLRGDLSSCEKQSVRACVCQAYHEKLHPQNGENEEDEDGQ